MFSPLPALLEVTANQDPSKLATPPPPIVNVGEEAAPNRSGGCLTNIDDGGAGGGKFVPMMHLMMFESGCIFLL